MGYLTTVTIYNDGVDELIRHPKELAKKLTNACLGVQLSEGRNYDSLGNSANLLTFQKPRHCDDHTLYLHAGNTLIDVNNATSDWVINQFISEMQYHLERLKSIRDVKV